MEDAFDATCITNSVKPEIAARPVPSRKSITVLFPCVSFAFEILHLRLHFRYATNSFKSLLFHHDYHVKSMNSSHLQTDFSRTPAIEMTSPPGTLHDTKTLARAETNKERDVEYPRRLAA